MSAARSTLEIVWQQDPTALAFARAGDGTLSAAGLNVGTPVSADLGPTRGIEARRVGVRDLVALAADPPVGPEPGGSARAVSAIVGLAPPPAAEGPVIPSPTPATAGWQPFWGTTP